jgi:hypothetical protein
MVKHYDDTQYPTIEQAYSELTYRAFAVWIRLMVATPDQLASGKKELSKVCNYSTSHFYTILNELHNKDYIRHTPAPLYRPHTIILHKRAMIVGRNHFVRLSNPSTPVTISNSTLDNMNNNNHKIQSQKDNIPNKISITKMVNKSLIQIRKEMLTNGRQKYVECNDEEIPLDEIIDHNSPPLGTPPHKIIIPNIINNNIASTASQIEAIVSTASQIETKHIAREQFSTHIKSFPDENNTVMKKIETSLSKKLTEKYREIKNIEGEKRTNRKLNAPSSIDYSKLDLRGDPAISFDPKSKQRDEIMAILSVKTHGKGAKKDRLLIKKRVIRKLSSEFARIYRRYRNMIQDVRGLESRFMMPPDSGKYCGKIAVQCIYNGITPRQLLEYWDENIGNFANGIFTTPYPTLSFLSGIFAAEQVAIALYESTSGIVSKWRTGDFKKADTTTHSFFNIKELDHRLKEGLKKAGYDVGVKYDDRYLLTVQKTAMAIANGKNLFVGGELKKMVKWAIKNLYGYND